MMRRVLPGGVIGALPGPMITGGVPGLGRVSMRTRNAASCAGLGRELAHQAVVV